MLRKLIICTRHQIPGIMTVIKWTMVSNTCSTLALVRGGYKVLAGHPDHLGDLDVGGTSYENES